MNISNPGHNDETSKFNQTPAGAPTPPPLIPVADSVRMGTEPLGSSPAERVPINGVIGAVEAILRQPRRLMYQLKQPDSGGVIISLFAVVVLCSLVYGLIVGTFSGGQQLWAAPVKITAGLLISGLICLPSLYIFSCLGGSQARLAEVFGLVAGLMTLMTVLLIGFAPVAWVFSQSTASVAVMGSLHLIFWLVATIFGVRFLSSGFSHLGARSYGGLRVWVVIFILVALQMTTALRPIIGTSDKFLPASSDKKFFIGHWADSIGKEQKRGQQLSGSTEYR